MTMPNKWTSLDHYFLISRDIFIQSDITDYLSYKIVRELKYLRGQSADPIRVWINSDGGQVESAMSIIDEIITSKNFCEIHTICQGRACSSAANILAFGTDGCRYATRNSYMMLHKESWSLEMDKADNQETFVNFHKSCYNDFFKQFCVVLGKKTAKSKKQLDDDMKHDLWLNPNQAIKYGLIDAIWKQ